MNRFKLAKKGIGRVFLFILFLNIVFLDFQTESVDLRKEDITIDTEIQIYQEELINEEFLLNYQPISSSLANSPGLANYMAPIVINMVSYPNIANQLNNKDYTNIRVAYYSANYEWIKVPFQIDEIGRPYRWEDHYNPAAFPQENPNPNLYQFTGYIPFGDPHGSGYDQNPGKIDGNDELCFYAYNGRKVSNYIWMDPGLYTGRIEVKIQDPYNGAESYMYIYYTNSNLGAIENEDWYHSYVNWNPSTYTITTSVYSLTINRFNFDLINQIRIMGTSGTNLVNSYKKKFRMLELAEPWYSKTEGVWPAGDGFANPGSYNTYKSAIDDPSALYNSQKGNLQNAPSVNNDISGSGNHQAVVNGPIRVILYQPRFEYSYSGRVMGVDAELHEQSHIWHKFYYNKMVNMIPYEEIDEPPSIAPNLYLYYMFQEIMELNTNIRTDFTLYHGAHSSNPQYGAFSNGLRVSYPDGNPNNDNYNHGGDPTCQTSPNYPNNPAVPDWQMLTSNQHGGLWRYLCRKEQAGQTGLSNMHLYWHDGAITETGLFSEFGRVRGKPGVVIPELHYTTIFGDFKPGPSIYTQGDIYYNLIDSNGMTSGCEFTVQSKPSGALFEYIRPERLFYMSRKETMSLEIKTNGAYIPSATFSVLDTNYDSNSVSLTNLGDNKYQLSYTFSDTNTRTPGPYALPVSISGRTDSSTIIELFPGDMAQILQVEASDSVLDQGDSGLDISVFINNPGTVPIEILEVNLQFVHEPTGNDVTNDYALINTPINLPYNMAGGTNIAQEFQFTVNSKIDATPEDIYLNATVLFIEGVTGYQITRYGAEEIDSWYVNDITPPFLTEEPTDGKIVAMSLGNRIEWNYWDYSPNKYNLSRAEGDIDAPRDILQYGTWNNENPIIVSLDSLPVNEYYYYLSVNDTFGNIHNHMVFINATDDPILLNSPSNRQYVVGETGNLIIWQASISQTKDKDSYWINYNNGERIEYYSWGTSNYFFVNIDGLEYGMNTVTCGVNTTEGDEYFDTVQVNVLNDQPMLLNSSGVQYYEGTKNNYISWEIHDLAQQNSKFHVYINGSLDDEFINGTWDGLNTISVNVDNLMVGEYNFTIRLNDGLEGTLDGFIDSEGMVWVEVFENESPLIFSDGAHTIEEGRENQKIWWQIIDPSYLVNGTSYEIYLDGVLVYSSQESWINEDIIEYILPISLERGVYNYTIYVDDGLGAISDNSIIVTVVQPLSEAQMGGTNIFVLLGIYGGITIPLSLIYKRMNSGYNPYEN